MRKTFVISVLLILFITAGAAAIAGPTQDGGGSAENPYLETYSITYGEHKETINFRCDETNFDECYNNLIEGVDHQSNDYVIETKQNGNLIHSESAVRIYKGETGETKEWGFAADLYEDDYLHFDNPSKDSKTLTVGEVKFELWEKTDGGEEKISEGFATVKPKGENMDSNKGKYLYLKANKNQKKLYMYVLSNSEWDIREINPSQWGEGDAVIEEVDTGGMFSGSKKCAIQYEKNFANPDSLLNSRNLDPDSEYVTKTGKCSAENDNDDPESLARGGLLLEYTPVNEMYQHEIEDLDSATPLHGNSINLYNAAEKNLARGYEKDGEGPYWFVCRGDSTGKIIDLKGQGGLKECEYKNGIYRWNNADSGGTADPGTDSTSTRDDRLKDELRDQEPAPTTGDDTDGTGETLEKDFTKAEWAAIASIDPEYLPEENVTSLNEQDLTLAKGIKQARRVAVKEGWMERNNRAFDALLSVIDRGGTVEGPGSSMQAADTNYIVTEGTASPYSSDGCYEDRNFDPVEYGEINQDFLPPSINTAEWEPGDYNCPGWMEGSGTGTEIDWEKIGALEVPENVGEAANEETDGTSGTDDDTQDGSEEGGGSDGGPTLDVAAEEMTEFSWKSYCANNQDDIGEEGINTDDGISAREAATCIKPSWGADSDEETPHNPDVTNGELVKDFCEPYYDYDSDATKCEVS